MYGGSSTQGRGIGKRELWRDGNGYRKEMIDREREIKKEEEGDNGEENKNREKKMENNRGICE